MTYLILSAFFPLLFRRLFTDGISIDNYDPHLYDEPWIIKGQEISDRDPKKGLRKATYVFALGSLYPDRGLNTWLLCWTCYRYACVFGNRIPH